MKRTLRFLFLALAVSMAVIMGSSATVDAAANDGKKQYIEDLVVAIGANYTEAKKQLDEISKKQNKKFYPLNDETSFNMRKSSATKDNFVLIGYSITTNKQDAITDIAMMYMLGQFDFDNEYKTILQEQKTEIHTMVQKMLPAFELFAENVEEAQDGNKDNMARFAYEVLDKFYNDDIIDEDTEKPVTVAKMITNADDYTDDQLDNMFMQMSGLAYMVIQKYVFMACVENWVSDMKSVSATANYSAKDYEKAKVILSLMPDFQENIVDYKKGGVSYNSSKADIENYLNNLSSEDDREQFVKYAYAEAGMRAIQLNENQTLFDLFMQSTDSETVVNSLLPIAYCIDDDYSCLLGITDLAELFYLGYTAGSDMAEVRSRYDLSELEGGSIYEGVDRSLYDADGIGVTSSAGKAINSTNQQLYDQYSKDAKAEKGLLYALILAGSASLILGIILVYTGISTLVAVNSTTFIITVGNGVSLLTKIGTFLSSTAAGGAVTIVIGIIFIAIFSVLLALYLVKSARAKKQENVLREIPRVMVDSVMGADGKRNLTYYYCVRDASGNCADINESRLLIGEQWNAIYYTKDAKAGNPLTTDSIKVSAKSGELLLTDSFMPVHLFGETSAYNVQSYNGSENVQTYFGFSRDDTPKEDETIEKTLPGATSIINGYSALFALGGAVAGALISLGAVAVIKRKKKTVISEK